MIDLCQIPRQPGCYLFSDEGGRIIYVGKAKELRRRVSSYFRRCDHDAKTTALVSHIHAVQTIVTSSEEEAFLLENNLIKRHQPKYNIDLKDAKGYATLRLTAEAFPRLVISRRRQEDGRHFGPFVSGEQRDEVRHFLIRVFRLRTCRQLPKRPCLRFHIGLCPAPCAGKISAAAYGERIARVVEVLAGRGGALIARLRDEMARHSTREEFEAALELRDQIAALERLAERQAVQRAVGGSEDVLAYASSGGEVCLLLFHVERGTLCRREEFQFAGGPETVEEFLARYYAENPVPKELILSRRPDEGLIAYLGRLGIRRVTVPQRGGKRQLLELARLNLDSFFFAGDRRIHELRERLDLPDPPETIDCIDISHLAGTAMVGSLVRFRHGKPDKGGYRRFRIKTLAGADDPAAIAEVVKRRFTRLVREGTPLPDLLVIDGGETQLAAARRELENGGLRIPVIAIAKRFEEIHRPGGAEPLRLAAKDPALLLIRAIRDEAHRFAVSYHRLLRRQALAAERSAGK